nr:MAG TPA: hypothetical protein [Caudoviricetes sp.]
MQALVIYLHLFKFIILKVVQTSKSSVFEVL